MVAVRHLGLLKYRFLDIGRRVDPGGLDAPPCQISSMLVNPWLRSEILKFFRSLKMAAAAILNFKNHSTVWHRDGSVVLKCIYHISSKSVNGLQKYHDFSIFSSWRPPPSWICLGLVWTTHEKYLMVFITVQNLVAIDALVSIIWKFQYLVRIVRNAYIHSSKIAFLRFPPLK